MAVTVEGTPTTTTVAAASASWSHTCGGDGLFVGICAAVDSIDVSGVTYDGKPMDELWDQATDAGIGRTWGFILAAPAVGAHTVAATFSGSASVFCGAVGLTGLHQTTPTRTVYKNQAAGAPSITVVDSENGDLVINAAVHYGDTIVVDGSGTSQVQDDKIAGGSRSGGISTKGASGANTVMSWTGGTYSGSGSGACALIADATVTPELEEPGAGATVIAGIVPTAAQYLFQHATPSGDIADGNWLHDGGTNVNMCFHINDGSVYDDADYIRSGNTPANDTYICEMTPIVTPEAGTVTVKVRARYL